MEAAAHCSLRVQRLLLDPKFEGYKLSLEPLACYQVPLESPVAEVRLRDEQYTLEHMRAFGMYNYLHLDSWHQDNIYYVDQLGRVMNLSVTLDTALKKPREVFRLPADLTACDDRLCASMHFTSSTWVTLSDGTGRLYLIQTGKRGEGACEKWEISFNEDFGSPFVLVHSTSFVKSNLHSISVLLLRVEKDELDVQGSGFHVSLEWVTISKAAKEGIQEYVVSKCQALHGKSVPHYAAIEPSSDGLMVVSYKPFAFVKPNCENEHEESEKGLEDAKKKEPLYYWQQSEDDLTVTLRLPKEFTKEGIQVRFSPDTISVGLKDRPLPLLEGSLYSSIDHESSTWIIKENNRKTLLDIKHQSQHVHLYSGFYEHLPAANASFKECILAAIGVGAVSYKCHELLDAVDIYNIELGYNVMFTSVDNLEISLIKKEEGCMWPELIIGDSRGELIVDPAQSEVIAERLMHLTSDEMNPDPTKENPPCNAQELEECDIFLEDSTSLCRFDGNSLKVTHVPSGGSAGVENAEETVAGCVDATVDGSISQKSYVNLGSNQYLFSAVVDPKEMPCFCLRHDVDALLWQPRPDRQDMWEHISTFNALGYVQASKRDKKFMACAPNQSYSALCECQRRVFIYRQPAPLSTVLYNRKEGRLIGQVAKQLVATLETHDPVLGFQATNERLFVLTAKILFIIKVSTEN